VNVSEEHVSQLDRAYRRTNIILEEDERLLSRKSEDEVTVERPYGNRNGSVYPVPT
jgi:hypothetical protein